MISWMTWSQKYRILCLLMSGVLAARWTTEQGPAALYFQVSEHHTLSNPHCIPLTHRHVSILSFRCEYMFCLMWAVKSCIFVCSCHVSWLHGGRLKRDHEPSSSGYLSARPGKTYTSYPHRHGSIMLSCCPKTEPTSQIVHEQVTSHACCSCSTT